MEKTDDDYEYIPLIPYAGKEGKQGSHWIKHKNYKKLKKKNQTNIMGFDIGYFHHHSISYLNITFETNIFLSQICT